MARDVNPPPSLFPGSPLRGEPGKRVCVARRGWLLSLRACRQAGRGRGDMAMYVSRNMVTAVAGVVLALLCVTARAEEKTAPNAKAITSLDAKSFVARA